MESNHFLASYSRINLKWVKDLIVIISDQFFFQFSYFLFMCTCVYLYEFMCTMCVQEAKGIQSPQTAVLGNCEQSRVNGPVWIVPCESSRVNGPLQEQHTFPTMGPSFQPRHNFFKKVDFIFNCMYVCLCEGIVSIVYCVYCECRNPWRLGECVRFPELGLLWLWPPNSGRWE